MTAHELFDRPDSVVRPVPRNAVGFRLRIELEHTSPPVWRSIDVPAGIHLDTVHTLLQAAMGWWDAHLHQFRQGNDGGSPAFVTDFDTAEGDLGVNEAEIRLGQVLADAGDEIGYLYDYGDHWEHTITVEEVLFVPPATPTCLAEERSCPSEDIGGADTFQEVAEWVIDGCPEDITDTRFDSELVRDWLPEGWHPETFSLAAATQAMQEAWVSHIRIVPDLKQLLAGLPFRAGEIAAGLLDNEAWYLHRSGEHLPTLGMLAPFVTFLDVIGDGVTLTQTKRLRRDTLKQYAETSGIAE